uniref:Uncharacterized protein n=1 Tax=Parascaris equorum TaxID=6256 RepID=A0A914S0N5_PAREQ
MFCIEVSNGLLQLRTVKNFVLDIQSMYSYDEGKKRKLYLLLFISFTQPFIMWWLTSNAFCWTVPLSGDLK